MAGFEPRSREDDLIAVRLDFLRRPPAQRSTSARRGLMLTNPSTLGLFDEGIEEVASIFHTAARSSTTTAPTSTRSSGSLGRATWGSTSSTTTSTRSPAAARRRRAAPGRTAEPSTVPALPTVVRDGNRYHLDHDRPKSIGRVRGFAGPFGVFVRSYAFIRAYGPALEGHVRGRRAGMRTTCWRGSATSTTCRTTVTACTSSRLGAPDEARARRHGARRREAAHGPRHPPADDHFPLVVPEVLMIDDGDGDEGAPFDSFVDAMRSIAAEAKSGAREPAPAHAPRSPPRRGEGGEGAGRPLRIR